MCQLTDSAKAVHEAARALAKECARLCGNDVGPALRSVYNDTLGEEVPEELKKLVDRLQ